VSDVSAARRRNRGTTVVAWVALAVVLVAACSAALVRRHTMTGDLGRSFDRDVEHYNRALREALDTQAGALDEAAHLFLDTPVPEDGGSAVLGPPWLSALGPGTLGLSHIVVVSPVELPEYLDRRANITGSEAQQIEPPGERDTYWLPLVTIPESNLRLPNIDNRAVPQNRIAMERSLETGTTTAAAPIDVPLADTGEVDDLTVFSMFRPVDATRPLTAERGWVSTTVLGDVFVAGVIPGFPHGVDVSMVSDGGSSPVGRHVGRDEAGGGDDPADHLQATSTLDAYGVTWEMRFESMQTPPAVGWSEPILIFVAGASLGLAMFAVLYVLARGRARALAVADHATSSLGAVEERFRSAFEDAPIGMALVGRDHTIQRVNRSLCRMLSRSANALVGSGLDAIAHADDVNRVGDHLDALMRGDPVTSPLEARFVEAHGAPVTASISASRVSEDSTGSGSSQPYFIVQIEDVSERKATAARLAHQASHDALTEVWNRSAFAATLEVALEEPGTGIAVLFIDLDRFKVVNDTLGHAAGDEVLRITAQRIEAALRTGDEVARMGGDEFTVLARDVADADDAATLARRIHAAVAEPIAVASSTVSVTPSIGIALSHGGHATPDSLLRDADTAQYRSKSHGRSRIEFFDAEARSETRRILEIEQELGHALESDEILLHYQPEVDLDTGAVTGVEALMRWDHPTRGLLAPVDFIDIAEESGLIVPLGSWAIREACRQARVWDDAGVGAGLAMSVNLSARQFLLPDLPDLVASALTDSAFDARRLCLEMTETALMDEGDATLLSLEALRALGVQLSVDDFGTGYSSLEYLKRFPVDWLKIDQSFVDGLGTDAEDTAIVTAVVSLAHALDLRVVAEGVETSEQLANLRTLGCDVGQGTYFSPPLPADELAEFLRRHDAGSDLLGGTAEPSADVSPRI